MDIVNESLISHGPLEWTSVEETITAAVREVFYARSNITCGSTNTNVPGNAPCPGDEVFLAGAIENGEIYHPEVRGMTEVRPRKGNNGCWAADFEQWDLSPVSRIVKYDIPKDALRTVGDVDHAELIAWGKSNGHLLPNPAP